MRIQEFFRKKIIQTPAFGTSITKEYFEFGDFGNELRAYQRDIVQITIANLNVVGYYKETFITIIVADNGKKFYHCFYLLDLPKYIKQRSQYNFGNGVDAAHACVLIKNKGTIVDKEQWKIFEIKTICKKL